MKLTIMAVLSLVIMSAANADQTDQFQELCKRPEVLSKMGPKGTCRIVVVPQKSGERSGTCTAKMMGAVPCLVKYAVTKASAEVSVLCGADLEDPLMGMKRPAQVSGHSASAIIKTEDGRHFIVTDETQYFSISSDIIDIAIEEKGEVRKYSLSMSMQGLPLPLSGAACI